MLEQLDTASSGPLVYFKRPWCRCEDVRLLINRSDLQFRNIKIVLLFCSIHNIGNLIETVAALLVASVRRVTSGRGEDVRT